MTGNITQLGNRLRDEGEVVSLARRLPVTPQEFLVLMSVRGLVDHRAIVLLELLRKWKNAMTPRIERATLRLVAQCLDQLRYRVPKLLY
jgi:hypothetical protein